MTRSCVGAILIRDREFLLVERSPDRAFYPGVWDVPGGHCAPGESLEQTLVRELDEELGIIPINYAFAMDLLEPEPERNGDGVYHMFLVTGWIGEPENRDQREHSSIEWFPLEAACALPLAHPSYCYLFRSVL